ncbi:MAG: hypothetical protein IT299_08545 [Dehalococcoidia bacterium]|nr:hypothetical protein [Dehalococcoidia bacterium]
MISDRSKAGAGGAVVAALAALAAVLVALWWTTLVATAQTPPSGGHGVPAAPVPGVISGMVLVGDGAAVDVEGVPVQLVQLGNGSRVVGETRAEGGRYRFALDTVSANATYVVSATVEGVTYLGAAPVILSSANAEAFIDVTVWNASPQRPDLTSQLSGITVVFVDTRTGEVTLQREDLVLNPTPRSWIGDAEGVTLAVPLAAGARNVDGESWYDGLPAAGTFTQDGDIAEARVVLRPGVTLLTTRYQVTADLGAAEVPLELRTALPTDELRILAPERFARALLPGNGATQADPTTIEDERVFVVQSLAPAGAGDVITARVLGLGGRLEQNPLSDRTAAIIGFGVVLLAIAGGAHLANRAAAARRVEAA